MGSEPNRPHTIIKALAPVVQVPQMNITLNQTSNPVADFIKEIKRLPSAFAKLKDNAKWHDWKKRLHVTAKSQAVFNILDPMYKPETTNEGLFEQ